MEELRTVHYVAAQDPLANLKLRVTLTRLSAPRPRPGVTREQTPQAPASDAGASSRADAAPASGSAGGDAAGPQARPEQLRVVKTFAWQEKVYSKAELVAAQAQICAGRARGSQCSSPKRTAHFGSQSHIGPDRLLMLNFHAMFLMADLGDETTVAGSREKVLCVLRAHQDGTFDMTPGLSAPGQRHRFEDDHGGIYEYTVELASRAAAPCLERRAAKLAGAVAAQAAELRRAGGAMEHMPPPGPDGSAVRLVLMAELVAAAGFTRDRLFLEWQLHYDPDAWALQHSEQEGVSHVSQMTCYPPDPASDTPALWVAHFAHPVEAEWVARAPPRPGAWPRLLLQVCTYDGWDRATTEGYGWLSLDGRCPGSGTHYVDTWKPLGTRRDQQAAFFIGGSEELADMAYVGVPPGHAGGPLNKYGFKTQTSGSVRVHSVLQTGAPGGEAPRRAAPGRRAAAAPRQHRELSLAVVLERARSRLQEARGGEVAVREGVVSQRPLVTVQPADVAVDEGANAQLSVTATGLGPLRYQWFKDGKRLTVATSTSPLLVLVEVAPADAGSYHCQVTNKDGSAGSGKALLSVARVGRLQHATGSSDGAEQPTLASTLAKRSMVPRTLVRGGGLPYSPRLGSLGGGGSAAPSGAASPLRGSLASLTPLGRRPATASGSSGAGAGGDDAAPLLHGSAAAGGSSGSASPLRRSLGAGGGVGGWGPAALPARFHAHEKRPAGVLQPSRARQSAAMSDAAPGAAAAEQGAPASAQQEQAPEAAQEQPEVIPVPQVRSVSQQPRLLALCAARPSRSGGPERCRAPQAAAAAPPQPGRPKGRPSLGKEKAKQRVRAISLIQKHAGANAARAACCCSRASCRAAQKEGQKTKWIVDLVVRVDEEHRADTAGIVAESAALKRELADLQASAVAALAAEQARVAALQSQAEELAAEHAAMRESLLYAEGAAAAATADAAELASAVAAATEQDARARHALSHRSHELREALLSTSEALRAVGARDRRQRHATEVRLRDKERALAAERAALLEQQAAHAARDAALETLKLKYHLASLRIREMAQAAGGRPDAAAGRAAGGGGDQAGAGSAVGRGAPGAAS
ncbi:MKS1 [Scenedesmus sp. PABB004]|nr:MKS1 [Scenedesmus sp. PABB004]